MDHLSEGRPIDVLAELVQVAERETGLEPNVDFALTALAAAYRLPEDAALILFAAGRTAGWLAHAIEQAMTGQLIRPRGRYTAVSLES